MRNFVVLSFVFMFFFCCFAGSQAGLFAAEKPIETAQFNSKLEKILKNQKEIIDRLEEMKQELNVVKIRATR